MVSLDRVAAIRGFNYQPSYSPNLQFTWTRFDRHTWWREVGYARRRGANTLRVWLDWSAYLAEPSGFLEKLDEVLALVADEGMLTMPVLFNRWNDPRYPAGGIFAETLLAAQQLEFEPFDSYLDGVVGRFGHDDRVVLWDLCNEPQAPRSLADASEIAWLEYVAKKVRGVSSIPLTIGTMTDDYVETYAHLVDVISFHPYPPSIGDMEVIARRHLELAQRHDKPLICTETCTGSFDDQERADLAFENLDVLCRLSIPWTAWHLIDGSFVSARRDRVDDNSVRPGEGYMSFLRQDGSPRPHHELVIKDGQVLRASMIQSAE